MLQPSCNFFKQRLIPENKFTVEKYFEYQNTKADHRERFSKAQYKNIGESVAGIETQPMRAIIEQKPETIAIGIATIRFA